MPGDTVPLPGDRKPGASIGPQLVDRLHELLLLNASADPTELHAALLKDRTFEGVGIMRVKRLLRQIKAQDETIVSPTSFGGKSTKVAKRDKKHNILVGDSTEFIKQDTDQKKSLMGDNAKSTKLDTKNHFANIVLQRDTSGLVDALMDRMGRPFTSLSDPNFLKFRQWEQARLQAEKPPTTWATNWYAASGGSANPKARHGHATFFINRLNIRPGSKTVDDVDLQSVDVIQCLSTLGWRISLKRHDTRSWENLLLPPVYLLDDQQPFLLQKPGAEDMIGMFTILHRNFIRESMESCCLGLDGVSTNDRSSRGANKEEEECEEEDSDAFGTDCEIEETDAESDEEHPEKRRRRNKRDFYGPVIRIDSSCKEGYDALESLHATDAARSVSKRRTAFLPHLDEVLFRGQSFRIVATTGQARSDEKAAKSQEKKNKSRSHDAKGGASLMPREEDDVSTLFTWFENGTQIARCLVTYHNGDEQQPGPCIEKLATKQERRGEDTLAKLYAVVEQFVLQRWRLIGRTPVGKSRLRIYAPFLKNTEIERARKPGAEDTATITDKMFFFHYQGFEALVCDTTAALAQVQRPLDEDAVKYIHPRAPNEKLVDLSGICLRKLAGRTCQFCNQKEMQDTKFLKCSLCKAVHYCSLECQRKDWGRHKLWCGKSLESVEEEMANHGFSGFLDVGIPAQRGLLE